MKDAYEILRLKEIDLSKVEGEVEALRIVAPLLSEDGDVSIENAPASIRWTAPTRPGQVPQAVNTNPQPEHSPEGKDRTAGFP
jgi:hypothetical protein